LISGSIGVSVFCESGTSKLVSNSKSILGAILYLPRACLILERRIE